MDNTRRFFLKKASMASLGLMGLQFAVTRCNSEFDHGFGPLSFREGNILSLPKGFSTKVISRKGDVMSDGLLSPGNHDGMGLFKWRDDKLMLIAGGKEFFCETGVIY